VSARRSRLNRVLAWAVILPCILAPLLAMGLLTQATLAYKQHPVRTGDPLADAYLQALVDYDLVADPKVQWQAYALSSIQSADQRDIPDRVWRELEQRFGNTADYWLLCFSCRPVHKKYLSPVAGVELWDEASYLEQARARGVADWRVVFWLLRKYSTFWEEEARSVLGQSDPGSKASWDKQFEYRTWRNAEVIRRHGPARRELFAALARAGADQAQAQYELAFRAFEDGDLASAISYMAAGNSAAHNTVAFGPPVTQLLAAAAQGQPLAGDRLLTGRLKQVYYGVGEPSYPRRLSMMRYLSRWAVERNDKAALSTLQRFSCRFGAATGASEMQANVGIIGNTVLLKAYRSAQPQLSSVQAQRCSAISLELGQIRSATGAIPLPSFGLSLTPQSTGWQRYWEIMKTVSDGGRSAVVNDLDLSCTELLARQSAVAKLQQRLEQFAPPLPWE
jgi:hypothetical protein